MTEEQLLSMIKSAAEDVLEEAVRAIVRHGSFNSVHEAYGVLLEEVDEFWDEVRKKREHRSHDAMRVELVQVAAMAIKAIVSIEIHEARK